MSEGAAERVVGEAADVRRRWGSHRFGYYTNCTMLWVGSRVLWLGYFFVWFGALYFFVCVPKARRASMGYLDRLRPGRSWVRRRWETYRHMIEFGMLLLDRAVMLMSAARQGFRWSCDGLGHLTKATAEGKGVLMVSGHFGTAEAAGAAYIFRMGVERSDSSW